MLGTASAAFGQASRESPLPQLAPTTIVEPNNPETPEAETPAKGPEHVPPDASGIDLTTLETKDLDLLYFDPVQTYLTPYIARAYENALGWHQKRFQWE